MKWVGVVGVCVLSVAGTMQAQESFRASRFLHTASMVQTAAETTASSLRFGVSGGMGVDYVNAQDVVDYINGVVGAGGRVPDFKAGVEFFAAATVPISEEWGLKIEYAYFLMSFNAPGALDVMEFTCVAHMPTLIGQYVLADEGVYNLKAGLGVGYHFGSLSEKSSLVNDTRSGTGIGTILDLEANTAFSDDFFGYFGADLRWEFIGELNGARTPVAGSLFPTPSLHFFSVGARFGFTYYFSPSI